MPLKWSWGQQCEVHWVCQGRLSMHRGCWGSCTVCHSVQVFSVGLFSLSLHTKKLFKLASSCKASRHSFPNILVLQCSQVVFVCWYDGYTALHDGAFTRWCVLLFPAFFCRVTPLCLTFCVWNSDLGRSLPLLGVGGVPWVHISVCRLFRNPSLKPSPHGGYGSRPPPREGKEIVRR
jgi:hypothetical protein